MRRRVPVERSRSSERVLRVGERYGWESAVGRQECGVDQKRRGTVGGGRLSGGGGSSGFSAGCFAPGSGWRRAAPIRSSQRLRPPRKGVRLPCGRVVVALPVRSSSAPPTRRPPLLRCPRDAPSLLRPSNSSSRPVQGCVVATGLVRLRYRLVATGASGGEQNGSSPGSSWSATASSPSSGEGGCCFAAASVPLRPLLSVSLGVGAFVRQRTVNSELVRTGGIRLSN